MEKPSHALKEPADSTQKGTPGWSREQTQDLFVVKASQERTLFVFGDVHGVHTSGGQWLQSVCVQVFKIIDIFIIMYVCPITLEPVNMEGLHNKCVLFLCYCINTVLYS